VYPEEWPLLFKCLPIEARLENDTAHPFKVVVIVFRLLNFVVTPI
jgi:hypothetical protein